MKTKPKAKAKRDYSRWRLIGVRVRLSTYSKLQARAEAKGISPTTLVRWLAIREAKRG